MRLHLIEQRVNNDSALINRGRWVTLTFTLGVGEVDYLITIKSGRIVKICKRDIQTLTGVFSIRASKDSWDKHWEAIPPRDYHDIFAMLAKKIVRIDGKLEPLMQNLQYFKDVIATPRDK